MNQTICTAISCCRGCGSADFAPVIDLGAQHIASIFVEGDVPEILNQTYPLEVIRCASGCGLVQLRHSISPRVLYDNYGYRSGTNELMRENLRDIASKVERLVGLRAGDTVLDIGCNDGTLLDAYSTGGLDRVGIDPAPNVASIAREKGFDVVNDFFTAAAFRSVRPHGRARAVSSIAMFYDLEDPQRFVDEVASLLAPDGVWVIELSYLPFMLEKNSFDTICHEHLEYYSLRQIEWMLDRAGLRVHEIEFNDVNGGSFRLFIRPTAAGAPPAEVSARLEEVRKREQAMGLQEDRVYEEFRRGCERVRNDLMRLLKDLRVRGETIYIYGASTKGNTILQYYGIDASLTPKAVDRNPSKWGRRTLGTNIPIISEEQARQERPDYFLALPWHFIESFLPREKAFVEAGGSFILPLPEVRVIGNGDS